MASVYSKRTLRELAVIIFSRWLTILLIAAILTGGTVLACIYAQKVYRSEVTLWARQSKSANPLESVPDPMSRLEVFLKTQQTIILSDTVLRRTMARIGHDLDEPVPSDPLLNPLAPPESLVRWDAWNARIDREAREFTGRDINKFRKLVKITTPGGEDVTKSEVFTISVEQPGTPEQAQRAADLLTQEYMLHRRLIQARMDDQSRDLLNKQMEDLRENTLGGSEEKFKTFIDEEIKGNLLELTLFQRAAGEVNHQKLRTAFQEELLRIDAQLSEYVALREEVKSQIPAIVTDKGLENLEPEDLQFVSIVIPESVMKNNAVISKMKLTLADLMVDRNALSEQYESQFALLRQKNGEIFRATCDIIRELDAELKAIDQQVSTLSARRAEIDRQVTEKNDAINNLSSLFVEYESLMRDVELSRTLYEQKRKDLMDAETAREMAQREILITQLNPATLADEDQPVRPILWLYTLVAAVVGLLLGIAYAFLADSYDHSVRTIDQAERYLGKAVIVSIPDVRGGMIR